MDTMRITCLLDEDYSVTMYGGCVALAPANPHDPRQHWLLHQAIKLKDRDAQPAFALINRATKQAMQSPATKGFPIPLVAYDPVSPDKSVLWTLSKDARHGYRRVRWLSDSNLILTTTHDTVCDGTNLLLWLHNNRSNNQYWKIEPYDADILNNLKACYPSVPQPTVPNRIFKICCRSKPDYNLTADEDTDAVMLARADSRNEYQKWIKDDRYGRHVKDQDGYAAFALMNKATGKAIKRGLGTGHIVRQGVFNPYYLDESLLWRESSGGGFREIRVHNDASMLLHAQHADSPYFANWALVGLSKRNGSGNQRWNVHEIN
ncbi:ricin B-like lectin R40C1 [Carex rostrata]